MSGDPTATAPHGPSTGYYVTFAAAMVGMVCLAVAIAGTQRALNGGTALDAINSAGVPTLVFAWALAFAVRFVFSPKLSLPAQAQLRTTIRLVIIAEIVVAVAGSWFVLSSGIASGDVRGILIAGDLAQIGSLIWLLRYSRR